MHPYILFSNKENQTNFIVAQNAEPIREFNLFKIELLKGSNLFISENDIKQIEFEKMSLNDINNYKSQIFYSIIEYWSRYTTVSNVKKDFAMFILISLLPLLSVFIIGSIGIINPRHTKNRSNLYLIVYVVLYYFLANRIAFEPFYLSLFAFPLFLLSGSYYLYNKFTLSRY